VRSDQWKTWVWGFFTAKKEKLKRGAEEEVKYKKLRLNILISNSQCPFRFNGVEAEFFGKGGDKIG
jgi:hypothetical protein